MFAEMMLQVQRDNFIQREDRLRSQNQHNNSSDRKIEF